MSPESPLGVCLARMAAQQDGLMAVYLPTGVDRGVGERIVLEANNIRPLNPPFAVFVSDSPTSPSMPLPTVTRGESIKFRQGDRLAVVDSTSVDLASFDGAFRELVGPGFPTTAVQGFDVDTLARTAIELLLENGGLDASDVDISGSTALLDRSLTQLANLLAEEQEGAVSWNAAWFRAADRGIAALSRAIRMAATASVTQTFDELVAELVWASFGLPHPDSGDLWAKSHKWSDFVRAFAEQWSSADAISLHTREAALALGERAAALATCESLGWEGIDEAVSRTSSPVLGLQEFITVDPGRLKAFASVTEALFFPIDSRQALDVRGAGGSTLQVEPNSTNSLRLASCSHGVRHDQLLTEELWVIATPHVVPPADAVATSRIRLKVSGGRATEESRPEIQDGQIGFRFRIELPVRTDYRLRKVAITLEVPEGDSLFGYLREAVVPIYVLPPVDEAIVLCPWTSRTKKAFKSPSYLGMESADDVSEVHSAELPSNALTRVVAKSVSAPSSKHILFKPIEGRVGWFAAELPENTPAMISINDTVWKLAVVGPSEAPQSLLLAAMDKVPVDPEDPSPSVFDSFRGQFETLLGATTDDDAFQESLGHVVLGEDVVSGLVDVTAHRGLLMPAGVRRWWDDSVNKEIRVSDAVREARAHYLSVWKRCVDLLPPVTETDAGRWPSKRSAVRLLRDRGPLIAELCDAYRQMLSASTNERNYLVRFQSAFPNSASIWTFRKQRGTCVAVLLSPWHPIRLAWLAETEGVLRDADRARELSGVLEGWQFPLVAPSASPYGRMVSVPIDAGEGQLFAGWSLMVRLSTDEPEPLSIPTMAAGIRLPGSSASGLSGSAVDAAVRDFRRMNSHLPTVTIDLASSSQGPRLYDLDSSVVRAARAWAKDPSPVRGVRVVDSLNRAGDLPRQELKLLMHTDSPTAVTWSRYEDLPERRPQSNLRLLQDSGVRARLDAIGSARPGGVVAPRPLRRFDTPGSDHFGSESYVEPGLLGDGSYLERAVHEIEGGDNYPRLGLELALTQLLDSRSDWTISGEAFISPSAVARQLAASTDSASPRMLWEWRPPFLRPEKGQPPLNRRPYLSVTKVSRALIDRITDQVAAITGQDMAGRIANDVFSTLGSQGIGLSSLLTMGGQHASGALGFYLALRLSNLAQSEPGTVRVVMPLDACQSFLDVLAPNSRVGEVKKRADLLVFHMKGAELTLSPVEIKFYGARGDGGPLKLPGSDFSEPLSQLSATMRCLQDIQEERVRLRQTGFEADAALWDNALTTLMEAALRLGSTNLDSFDTRKAILENLSHGSYSIRLGRPLILFFNHQAGATDEFASYIEGRESSPDPMGAYGAISARPHPALASVTRDIDTSESPQLVKVWGELMAWSVLNAVPEQYDTSPNGDASGEPIHTEADSQDASVVPRLDPVIPDTVSPEYDLPQVPTTESDPSEYQPADTTRLPPNESSTPANEPHFEAQGEDHGVRFPVGSFKGGLGAAPAEYWPSNSETTQLNMGIVGDLGTGKTQLLQAILLNLRQFAKSRQQTPLNGLVFDYKQDFQKEEFTKAVGAKIWQPTSMPLNVLDLHDVYTAPLAYRRAASFTTMLQRIYPGIGPVQRDKLISTIMQLFEDHGGQAPTLGEVLERYSAGARPDSVTAVLNTFVLGQVFSEDRTSLVSLEEAMADTVLVVALNSLGADTYTKNAIVVLFLEMFYESMKRRGPLPPRVSPSGATLRTLTSYLLVDEASNIMQYGFHVLESLLKEGREFGVGTILSSQYLSHFGHSGVNYAETLSTWFIHKVPNATKSELSSLGIPGATVEMAERIKSLRVHESLYRSDLSPAHFIRDIPFWRLVQESGRGEY